MRFAQAALMLLGAIAYVAAFTTYDTPVREDYQRAILITFIGWNTLLLIVTALVIVDSVLKIRARKTEQLATGALLVKLAAIPFFLTNFVFMAAFGTLGTVALDFAGVPAILVVLTLTYVALLSTSLYGWASAIQLRRDRRINTVLAVLYSLLLFSYTVDVLAAILLFVHSRRGRAAIGKATP